MAAVLDTYFGGDEVPIAFGDWPAVRAARSEPDAVKMVEAFGPNTWGARPRLERRSSPQMKLTCHKGGYGCKYRGRAVMPPPVSRFAVLGPTTTRISAAGPFEPGFGRMLRTVSLTRSVMARVAG